MSDAIERLTEIAHRDSATSVTVRADDLRIAVETIRRNEGRRLFELCVQHGAKPGHVLAWLKTQLAQSAHQTPEGFALVPVEPTPEMLEAGLFSNPNANRLVYKAMLAAAPKGDSHE